MTLKLSGNSQIHVGPGKQGGIIAGRESNGDDQKKTR
jgi:hypothetical protein